MNVKRIGRPAMALAGVLAASAAWSAQPAGDSSYRLLALELKPSAPAAAPAGGEQARAWQQAGLDAALPPPVLYIGCAAGRVCQLWWLHRDNPLMPALIQVRDRDDSKLRISRDGIQGTLQFKLRRARSTQLVAVAVELNGRINGPAADGKFAWKAAGGAGARRRATGPGCRSAQALRFGPPTPPPPLKTSFSEDFSTKPSRSRWAGRPEEYPLGRKNKWKQIHRKSPGWGK